MSSIDFSLQSWREGGKPRGTKTMLTTQLSAGGSHGEVKETLAISGKTEASQIHSLHLLWLKIKGSFPFNWGAHSRHCKFPNPAWCSICYKMLRLLNHSQTEERRVSPHTPTFPPATTQEVTLHFTQVQCIQKKNSKLHWESLPLLPGVSKLSLEINQIHVFHETVQK